MISKLSDLKIVKLIESPSFLNEMKEIFFETSSRKIFSSDEEKENFFNLWTSYYLNECRDHVYFAISNNKLLGYLTGCLDSFKFSEQNNGHNSFYLFSDLFLDYPAHLHINCTKEAQGKGVGRKLIEKFFEEVERGVHIITLKSEENVKFYEKCGFDFSLERENLYFMGKKKSS